MFSLINVQATTTSQIILGDPNSNFDLPVVENRPLTSDSIPASVAISKVGLMSQIPPITSLMSQMPHTTSIMSQIPPITSLMSHMPHTTSIMSQMPHITNTSLHMPHTHSMDPCGQHIPLDPHVSEFVPRVSTSTQQSGFSTQSTWVYPSANPVPVAPPTLVPQSVPVSVSTGVHSGPGNQFESMIKSFTDQVTLNRLPVPEPSVFDGDALNYPSWKHTFEALIGSKGIPPSERTFYLKKYIAGPARDAVEGFFLVPTPSAYEEAKSLLEERYGHPFVITNAFRAKLDAWHKIPARDGLALRKFADFLRQCETAMQISAGTGLHILNDRNENRKMLSKLPDWLVSRWGRIEATWQEGNRGFPPFSEFRIFIVNRLTLHATL